MVGTLPYTLTGKTKTFPKGALPTRRFRPDLPFALIRQANLSF